MMDPDTPITLGSLCGGIGDNLVFTPLMKYYTNITIELLDHPKSRIVAPIFDDLCKVKFTDTPSNTFNFDSSHPHVAQKKIEAYGISHIVNCIPKIKLKQNEIYAAEQELNNIKNPIAFVSDNNGSGDPNDWAAKYRIPNKNYLQYLIDSLSENYTVIQFGLSKNLTKFNNTLTIPDLPIRKLAAYYSCIKKYIGIDTGDYHLMLSVGGNAEVHCPQNAPFHYPHDLWHYEQKLWKNEECRVKYVTFS